MGYIADCQHDMLIRMISENPNLKDKKINESHRNKIKSAPVFNTLIKHDMIVGYTNNQAYNLYCEIAKTLQIEPLSKIDFSRTLCKYYGFSVIDMHSRKDNVKYRLYVKDKNKFLKNRKLQSFLEFIMSKSVKDIVGKTNNDLYSEYLEFFKSCGDKGWKKPISKIDFGRRISNTIGVKIKTVHRNKKTYRIYLLKEGDDNGNNSPSQESLG